MSLGPWAFALLGRAESEGLVDGAGILLRQSRNPSEKGSLGMAAQAPLDAVVSHWSTLIEGFQAAPLSFYTAVEEALARRRVPETKNSRVDFREAGLLSSNREYLHVTREKLTFDICGAPLGTGFFVSWWLAEEQLKLHPVARIAILLVLLIVAGQILINAGLVMGLILVTVLTLGGLAIVNALAQDGSFDDGYVRALPLIGSLYVRLFKPGTYYRIDTMLMFQKAVHNAVLEVIDSMTATQGLRALSETDRKPVLRDFYTRAA